MKRIRLYERRTKIVCTIGPSSGSAAVIERLIKAGMNVARLNLSHGEHREHDRYIKTIRKLSQRLGINVAILMDLPGPKYRIGKLESGKALLEKGAQVVLTTRRVTGNAALVPVSLPNLPQDVRVGDIVLLDDGAIQLRVIDKGDGEITCRVTAGGVLTVGRGLVVPGMRTSSPFITEALRQHILFAIEEQPEYLALSFVSSAKDVAEVRAILRKDNADVPIIAKIERGEAVDKFDTILAVTDGIMVARGDLGVDIPLEKVPLIQKEIIRKCNQAGKPVITATQMLESMVNSPSPTRAEVADVANAIFDGTDATMLSEETAIGKYPVQALKMMARVAQEAESNLPYEQILAERENWLELQTDELIGYNACLAAQSLRAAAIVALTQSGSTAGRLSKYRPRMPILAITPNSVTCGRLLLRWGVYPFLTARPSSVDNLFVIATKLAKDLGIAKPGDLIVITGGIPLGVAGSTNLLKVENIQ